jgi:hypothetical protein
MRKPEDHDTTIIFKAPLALRDDLRRVAEQHDRSLSAQIRIALREHIRRDQEGAGTKP